jgi:hypothetical protein
MDAFIDSLIETTEFDHILLPEPQFVYTPLPVAAFIDNNGFLPKEHRKKNHAVMCTVLRRALFNDELIRFITVQQISGDELTNLAETAWTMYARLKTGYGTRDRHSIRAHLYAAYRPNARVPAVPDYLCTPPIDTIYVSGRKFDMWSCELQLQRMKDHEDTDVPRIMNLDVNAVLTAQASPTSRKRDRQIDLDAILDSPLSKNPRIMSVTALEDEIARIKAVVEAKEKELLLMKKL